MTLLPIHFQKRFVIKILVIFVFLVIKYIIPILFKEIKINLLDDKYPKFVKLNEFPLSKLYKNINSNNKIFFNLTSISFSFDSVNNIIKTEFTIGFYDENKDVIFPSDLTLYYNIHIYCIMKDFSHSTIITSLPNIVSNKHFLCQEFFHKNEKIQFKVGIYQNYKTPQNKEFQLFTYNINNFYNFDNIISNNLDCFHSNKEYELLYEKIYKKNITQDNLKLKSSYIIKPKCTTKFGLNLLDNKWNFINLYNYYFCICKGLLCKSYKIPQKCIFIR
jgi:hypothetical protein